MSLVGDRCAACTRPLALMSIVCKCGGVFCLKHRYPESHACTFDHKTTGKAAISSANPRVVAKKVADI